MLWTLGLVVAMQSPVTEDFLGQCLDAGAAAEKVGGLAQENADEYLHAKITSCSSALGQK